MLDASGNRDAQEKMQFSILKSATLVAGKDLDSRWILQIPGCVDSTFNSLSCIANQGEIEPSCLHLRLAQRDLCVCLVRNFASGLDFEGAILQ